MSILLFHSCIHIEPRPATKPTKQKTPFVVGVFAATILLVAGLSYLQRSVAPSILPSSEKIIENKFLSLQSLTNAHVEKILQQIPRPSKLYTEPARSTSLEVPILMYHHTPADFENQIVYLRSAGYSFVTMRELGEYLYSSTGVLPPKPVVITYDDGFASAQQAFAVLQKYQAKATFFIMPGGNKSNFCIGVERTNITCGDAYLNWSQLRTMQATGLIEIGSHTLNHADLPTLTLPEQEFEIVESKRRIEAMLEGPVLSFAFPYGRYSQESIDMVQKAGYYTAVTTQSGTTQSTSSRYTLTRVRDAYLLP